VVGIDLAEDKQAIAVTDHDVRVLAHKTVRVKAFRLGETVGQARAKGFTRVTMACEPTGSRWMQVQRLCAERSGGRSHPGTQPPADRRQGRRHRRP